MVDAEGVAERLREVEPHGSSHEMLAAIARAVMPHVGPWNAEACAELRDVIVALADAATPRVRWSGGEWSDELERVCEERDELAEKMRGLAHDVEMWRDRAEDMRMERDDSIGHAYIDVTPRIDWSALADELDEFALTVRSFGSGERA